MDWLPALQYIPLERLPPHRVTGAACEKVHGDVDTLRARVCKVTEGPIRPESGRAPKVPT